MEHGGWNSHCGTEHGTHTADGSLIVQRNMEHGGWNSHCGMQYVRQRMVLSLWNGKWNTTGGTLIVEWNMEQGG